MVDGPELLGRQLDKRGRRRVAGGGERRERVLEELWARVVEYDGDEDGVRGCGEAEGLEERVESRRAVERVGGRD